MAEIRNISVARDFSKFPGGRYYTDGPFSGEKFRKEYLIPALKEATKVVVDLDGVSGFGSSFLDEAFAGLVRDSTLSKDGLFDRINLISHDDSYIEEIRQYVSSASAEHGG